MKQPLSLQSYRFIDLCLFGLMLAVFEYIIVMAANSWFPQQAFAVSLAGAIASIVYMRWGLWGIIHAGFAGIVYCYFSGGTTEQYIIYTCGNMLSAIAVIMPAKLGYEKVRTGQYLSLIFPFTVQVLMYLGRALTALIIGKTFAEALGFITGDPLSLIFTLVIIWIVKRSDGIYENQKHYLLRINEKNTEDEDPYYQGK